MGFLPFHCRHCGRPTLCRARGLCSHCYQTPEVRVQYRPKVKNDNDGKAEPQTPKPLKRRGDPAWRCLWCFRWRCDGPLMTCGDCKEEYRAMAVGLPE